MTIFYCLRFETPPTWRAGLLYLYPPGARWPCYTPKYLCFDSPGIASGVDPQKTHFLSVALLQHDAAVAEDRSYIIAAWRHCCRVDAFIAPLPSNVPRLSADMSHTNSRTGLQRWVVLLAACLLQVRYLSYSLTLMMKPIHSCGNVEQHGVANQNIVSFVVTAVRTSSATYYFIIIIIKTIIWEYLYPRGTR
jgi:hypothetical protein